MSHRRSPTAEVGHEEKSKHTEQDLAESGAWQRMRSELNAVLYSLIRDGVITAFDSNFMVSARSASC
jgi:hypothetical protein